MESESLLVMCGRTGSGKSYFINKFFDAKLAKEGDTLQAGTTKMAEYMGKLDGRNIKIIDTIGFADGNGVDDETTVKEIKKLLKSVQDGFKAVLYCMPITKQILDDDDKKELLLLRFLFGTKVVSNLIIVLTQLNLTKNVDEGLARWTPEEFSRQIEEFKNIPIKVVPLKRDEMSEVRNEVLSFAKEVDLYKADGLNQIIKTNALEKVILKREKEVANLRRELDRIRAEVNKTVLLIKEHNMEFNKLSTTWIDSNLGPKGELPDNHVQVSGCGTYIAAVCKTPGNQWFPGKYNSKLKKAYYGYKGKEYETSNFKIICKANSKVKVVWEKLSGGKVSKNAVGPFGNDSYIGAEIPTTDSKFKDLLKEEFHTGAIYPSLGCLKIPFNGEEAEFTSYYCLNMSPSS